MTSHLLGCYPASVVNGTAYGHNGGLGFPGGQGLMTSALRFPDGTDAAWVCNTLGPGEWYRVLAETYDTLNGVTTSRRHERWGDEPPTMVTDADMT